MISLRSLHTLLPEMDTRRRDALCYLIHGWSLAVLNQGLASRVYSDPQGPVFEDTEETDTITVADEVFLAIVNRALVKYANTPTEDLERHLTGEGTPWDDIKTNRFGCLIRDMAIKDYFISLALEPRS